MRAFRSHPLLLLLLLTCAWAGPGAAARTIEFTTTEVTEADVTLSPDGQWLIFTILGHLFRLPVTGGTAEQLTFGPYYDADPVFSPDGTRVAFVSDRDGSEGNTFVLELATGQITQVTHEPWAGRPTWTPDGEAMVYLRFDRTSPLSAVPGSPPIFLPAVVRRISLRGGEPETVSAPERLFRSVFYLPDGRLAWTVVEREADSVLWTTRVEVLSPDGGASPLRTIAGYVDRVVASPLGEGLYCRRFFPLHQWYPAARAVEELTFLPLPEGAERQILPVLALWWSPRFAVATDDKTLYVGNAGRLWKIALSRGAPLPIAEPIAFKAKVRLEIQDPVAPPKPAFTAPGSSMPLRGVLSSQLSRDGRNLVFMAAGYLWQQPLDGGPARRLLEGSAFDREPTLSPDGRQIAFVHSEYGEEEVRVFDLESRQVRTLASRSAYTIYEQPSWSPDGQKLVFAQYHRAELASVVAVNLSDGKRKKLAEVEWTPHPQFSPDGESLYFSDNRSGTGTLFRLPLKEKAKPEPVTQLAHHLSDALVSPDGKWLAYRRNAEIWVAPVGKEPVTEEDVHQLSPEEGDTFAFTPDGSAVIYSAGNRVWRHPLAGGERQEIPIRLELNSPKPPPLLVRRVRLLDFSAGGFGPETSLFIEQGRIRWIGSERGRKYPPETVRLDAGGRFAIPGLFDLHQHSWDAYQATFLAYGITSVRDVGSYLSWLNALADRGDMSSDPLPRFFFSGDLFFGAWPPVDVSVLLYTENDARTYVSRWKELGAHFIKVHPPISWPLQRAVADEARRVGLPVVGHGTTLEEMTKSVTLGYWSLEHHNFPGRVYDDVLQMLAAAGTRWDPTLVTTMEAELMLRDEPERVDAKLRAFFPEGCLSVGTNGMRAVEDMVLRGDWVEELASIRAAYRRGVKLQAGSDILHAHWRCFPAVSLHWELEYFVQAGIPPLEVLRIATQQAAEAVGAGEDLGTLEPGKLADIVLLDKNPLEDIRNTQTIWRVIKGGWLFDPEKLRPPASIGPDK